MVYHVAPLRIRCATLVARLWWVVLVLLLLRPTRATLVVRVRNILTQTQLDLCRMLTPQRGGHARSRRFSCSESHCPQDLRVVASSQATFGTSPPPDGVTGILQVRCPHAWPIIHRPSLRGVFPLSLQHRTGGLCQVAEPLHACEPLNTTTVPSLVPWVALIRRGHCSFLDKVFFSSLTALSDRAALWTAHVIPPLGVSTSPSHARLPYSRTRGPIQ